MIVENNYYSIACNDYRYLLCNLDSDFYNNMAVSCQQIVEKAMKSVLVYVNPDVTQIPKANQMIFDRIGNNSILGGLKNCVVSFMCNG